jgi:ribosome modulation factor
MATLKFSEQTWTWELCSPNWDRAIPFCTHQAATDYASRYGILIEDDSQESEFRSPAHRAGYMAGIEGLPLEQNPYGDNTLEAIDWTGGWKWSESIRQEWLELHA